MLHAPTIGFLGVLALSGPFGLAAADGSAEVARLANRYVAAWQEFYPSAAFAAGAKEAAFRFEDLGPEPVKAWVATNRQLLADLERLPFSTLPPAARGDLRLLRRQCRQEIERWQIDDARTRSAGVYADLLSQALTHLLVSRRFSEAERFEALTARMGAIRRLCEQAKRQVTGGSPGEIERAAASAEDTARFLADGLAAAVADWMPEPRKDSLRLMCAQAASAVQDLARHLRAEAMPRATGADTLGGEAFARKLSIYTDSEMTPAELESLALAEIERVRLLVIAQARIYWKGQYPTTPIPDDPAAVVHRAIGDMESNRVSSQKEFLELFTTLTDAAERFVREKGIAEVPAGRALRIDLSPPHFAGAAVGGVYPAGPFDPQGETLFYLPTVPDQAPPAGKEGFYRSFNNHFNTMIIVHEMFPGHFLQAQVAVQAAPPWRSLFADDLYVEGWATLMEQVCLDAGWDHDHPLTRLAHLRKILENAVRAYAAVQVHCHAFGQDQLTRFAVDRGLLAPQFAINLWRRVLDSPMQITSYFLGHRQFQRLLADEKRRLGTRFSMRAFSDRVLRTGPLPIDELSAAIQP